MLMLVMACAAAEMSKRAERKRGLAAKRRAATAARTRRKTACRLARCHRRKAHPMMLCLKKAMLRMSSNSVRSRFHSASGLKSASHAIHECKTCRDLQAKSIAQSTASRALPALLCRGHSMHESRVTLAVRQKSADTQATWCDSERSLSSCTRKLCENIATFRQSVLHVANR